MRYAWRDVTVGGLIVELAAALPDREALVYDQGPRYTFAQLERASGMIARGLMAIGVEPGDRVVLWATNVPEWVVLQFALARIGAVLVTANTSLRTREIDYLLRQSRASTVIAISGFRGFDYVSALRQSGAVTGPESTVKRLIHIGSDTPAGFLPYPALRDLSACVAPADLSARASTVDVDAVINMQYTSGTTGFPKGVMLSSRNIVNNGEALGAGLALTPDDRLCLCVPLFHCFGCVIGVLGAYTHGACLCPVEWFDPGTVLQTIQRERCTAVYGVPTMFLAELECPDFARYDLSSLRTGIMAGALCPETLMRRVIDEMHLPEITIAYGLTESSPGITLTPRDASVVDRSQTVGLVLPELEVKIVDPSSGAERPCGEPGELCCRGYNVMKGYYDNAEATRAAIDDEGWLHTGDEGTIDERGYVRITGRIKDLIIRGGENIAPREIEDRLREHPAVADAYAYGVPDAYFGEAVAAAVRLKPEAALRLPTEAAVVAQELLAWCAAALARFKVPRDVRFVTGFPQTASGKVQKFKLREEHVADFSTTPRTTAPQPN